MAVRMPSARPAWAGPHVSRECSSERKSALLINRVKGLTGQFGCKTVKTGMLPGLGKAMAVRNACSSGPPFSPTARLRCAALAPAPAHASAYQTLFVLSIDDLPYYIIDNDRTNSLPGLQ